MIKNSMLPSVRNAAVLVFNLSLINKYWVFFPWHSF